MGIHLPNRLGLHLHEKLHPEVPILFGLLRYLRGDAALPGGFVFSIRLFFGAGRNYECCQQPGGGQAPLILGMWDLDVALGCHVLFDCHLIQVPNFQKLSWNRIYPEAPLPKKLTAFGNLEDVKPPCQLGGDTSQANMLIRFESAPEPKLRQVLQVRMGWWWGMEGRMGEGISPLDMLGSRNPKGWYSNTVFSFQTFVIMNVVGINEQVPATPGAAFHSRCYNYHILRCQDVPPT